MLNPYLPVQTKIMKITDLTADTKLFRLDQNIGSFKSGQFIFASIFGYGEAAISIASSPLEKNYFEIGVKNVGKLTNQIHKLKVGDSLGIRGPYGNGYNLNHFKNKNIIMISGGCGIFPLRSIINYIEKKPTEFGDIEIIIGARTPKDIIFKDELKDWKDFAEILITVDKPDSVWQGNTGLITNLINRQTINSVNTLALLCGPPVMYKNVSEKLEKYGIHPNNIYFSLERHMKCGIGHCQRCTCGKIYICKDGPVFSLTQVEKYNLF